MSYAMEMSLKGFLDFALQTGLVFGVPDADFSSNGALPFPHPLPPLNDLPPKDPQSLKRSLHALLLYSCHISYERCLMDIMVETLPGFLYSPGCRVSQYVPRSL